MASNTSQFLQYFILLFGILAGISTARLMKILKYPILQLLTIILLILFMIPTQAGLLKDFYGRPAFAKISKLELSALEFLNKNSKPDSVILTPPKNNELKENAPTPDIWAWADTGYVAALSGRREFFADQEQVNIMGYNFSQRQEIQKKIFEEKNPEIVQDLIKSSGINYLYFPKPLAPKIDLEKIGLTQILDNQEVSIWRATDK